MITRTFRTIADVKQAVAGYKLLFGIAPTMRLSSEGTMYDGNDPIFARRHFPILSIGTKAITIEVDGQPCRIRPDVQHYPLYVIFD